MTTTELPPLGSRRRLLEQVVVVLDVDRERALRQWAASVNRHSVQIVDLEAFAEYHNVRKAMWYLRMLRDDVPLY